MQQHLRFQREFQTKPAQAWAALEESQRTEVLEKLVAVLARTLVGDSEGAEEEVHDE